MAEAVGTFCLVFAGTGAIVVNDLTGGTVTHVGIALTFGLVVFAMIAAFGEVSGAHLNPAVSVGLALARRFRARDVPGYVVAQLLGAFAASGLLRMLFPSSSTLGATLPAGSAWPALAVEVVLAFMLMLVILRATGGSGGGADRTDRRFTAGAAIASVVALEALFAGPISGASMNPVRSLAPAVVSGHGGAIGSLWVYVVAPVVGAAFAVPVDALLRRGARP